MYILSYEHAENKLLIQSLYMRIFFSFNPFDSNSTVPRRSLFHSVKQSTPGIKTISFILGHKVISADLHKNILNVSPRIMKQT